MTRESKDVPLHVGRTEPGFPIVIDSSPSGSDVKTPLPNLTKGKEKEKVSPVTSSSDLLDSDSSDSSSWP